MIIIVAAIKTHCNKKEYVDNLPPETKQKLIDEGYWDGFWNMLTEKAYKSHNEWFNKEYVGSKKEKLEMDDDYRGGVGKSSLY